MSAKEEDGKLDVGWLHSTIRDLIDLVENLKKNNKKTS